MIERERFFSRPPRTESSHQKPGPGTNGLVPGSAVYFDSENDLPVKSPSVAYFRMAIGLLALGLGPAGAVGAADLPREIHPWGRFEAGAWKIVRATSEGVGGTAEVLTTDTRTTLEGLDEKSVTLRVEVLVEVAGKRFRAEPQTIRQGVYGEPPGDNAMVVDLGEQKLTVQGRDGPLRTCPSARSSGRRLWALIPIRASISRAVRPGWCRTTARHISRWWCARPQARMCRPASAEVGGSHLR